MKGEATEAWRAREAMAVRVKTMLLPTVNRWERDLGFAPTTVPTWDLFGAPTFELNTSPLLGPMSADTMARLDYFSWQAINRLGEIGTIVPERPSLQSWPWQALQDFSNSPIPSVVESVEVGPIEYLTLEAKVGPKKGRIIGYPGQGTHDYQTTPNNWQSDHAVDISLPRGTPIIAVADGVICAGCGFGPHSGGPRFAGERLTLNYGPRRNRQAYYAHLDQILVGRGDRVRAGQIIGYSGVANGVPHLHFATDKFDPLKIATARRVKPWR